MEAALRSGPHLTSIATVALQRTFRVAPSATAVSWIFVLVFVPPNVICSIFGAQRIHEQYLLFRDIFRCDDDILHQSA